ncbi:MAG: hypothetical protein ACOYYU_15825 [Chloroflexota bacterium]
MTTQMKTKGCTSKIFFLFLCIALCCGLAQGYKELNYQRLRSNWEKTTTPLPHERIDILCKNFGLDKSHELCNGKRDVYGPDFYDLIQDTFKPELTYRAADDAPATYEQVEKMIGIFKTECEPIAWLAYEQTYYYRCDYDLRGDGEYVISIGYDYPENTVYKITAGIDKESHD